MTTSSVGGSVHREPPLRTWRKRARVKYEAHFREYTWWSKWNQVLGVGIVILAAVAGSSIFTTVDTGNTAIQLTAGVLAMVAAILTAVKNSLTPSKRAEEHRIASADWGALQRKMEALTGDATPKEIDEIATAYAKLDATEPYIRDTTFEVSRANVDKKITAEAAEAKEAEAEAAARLAKGVPAGAGTSLENVLRLLLASEMAESQDAVRNAP